MRMTHASWHFICNVHIIIEIICYDSDSLVRFSLRILSFFPPTIFFYRLRFISNQECHIFFQFFTKEDTPNMGRGPMFFINLPTCNLTKIKAIFFRGRRPVMTLGVVCIKVCKALLGAGKYGSF